MIFDRYNFVMEHMYVNCQMNWKFIRLTQRLNLIFKALHYLGIFFSRVGNCLVYNMIPD